jgi:hypothetical protein
MVVWTKCEQRSVLILRSTSLSYTSSVYSLATKYSKKPRTLLFLCFAKSCFVQICDMVTVARYLNLTMVIPELDKQSFWADPRCAFLLHAFLVNCRIRKEYWCKLVILFSDFGDIFDVNHFIDSLRNEVKIVKELPQKFKEKVPLSMQPISWSSEKYYLRQVR